MDDNQVKTARLRTFLENEIDIEIPLFHNNPGHAVKLDIEEIGSRKAYAVIESLLQYLFQDRAFWACEMGADSASTFLDTKMLKALPVETYRIPHSFRISDDFEYNSNFISCCHTDFLHFDRKAYIRYALRLEFLSNTILLVDDVAGIAVHIYDRRGLDIISTDTGLLVQLADRFRPYISSCWSTGIKEIDNGVIF